MDAMLTLKSERSTISPASLIAPSHHSVSSEMSPTPSDDSSASPPPEGQSPSDTSDGQHRKKRKSWGQVLPEPTTNLPPRKRAKTDAEKAQRKYERVQRNRQAAHNSRLRKQNEMDRLQEENNKLREKVTIIEAELAQLKKDKSIPNLKFETSDHDSAYDSDHQPSPASPSFNDFTFNIAQSADTHSAVDAGFANIPGGAWDAFDSLNLASPLNNTSSSFTSDQNVLMDDLLNLEGLQDSGQDSTFDFTFNPENTTFDPTFDPSVPNLFDFDPSSMDFNLLPNDVDLKSFTCPLFNDIQASSWPQ